MTAQIVVGLYESKGYALDARNRLQTEGVPLDDMSLVVLHDIAPVPEALREEEFSTLAVSPLILGDVERTFASYIKNGETAVIIRAATETDAQFAIEIMALYDPLAIEIMEPRVLAAVK
jgi:hypothetical protein